MIEQSVQEVLENFNPESKSEKTALTRHITVWVTEETKQKYDLVQGVCAHRFTKVLRDVMNIAIDNAASKIVR